MSATRPTGTRGGMRSRAAAVLPLPRTGAATAAPAPHPLATESICTETANAQELVRLAGGDVRYVHAWRRWLAWDGQRWAPDDTGRLEDLARMVADGLFDRAAAAGDDRERRTVARHAVNSASRRGIEAMIALAATEAGVPIRPDVLDADPMRLTVANGTLDLRSGELREHRPLDYMTKLVPWPYDPAATCPRWLKFLEEILPDPSVRVFLQKAVGYSLTGNTSEQCLFLLCGSGANGKSVLLETLMDLVGDYGLRTPSETLLARRGDAIPNDLAALRGARLVVASETEDGRRLAESRIKELTSGDTISARFMRSEWFSFRPVGKLFLATNHRPQVRGTDHAIWRRIRLIPFDQTFGQPGGPPADPHLRDKLRAELPGILAWAVTGSALWHHRGMTSPEAVTAATAAYRTEQDVLGDFFTDAVEIDKAASATAAELFGAYRDWCTAAAERPMTKTAFGRALQERGFHQVRTETARMWHGLRLRAP